MLKLSYCLVIMLLVSLTACTSMQTIEATPTAVQKHFVIGEIITVHTVNDTIYEFELIDITEDSIVGKRQQIPFSEIQKLEKKKVGVVKSIGAGIGMTYLVVTGVVGLFILGSLF